MATPEQEEDEQEEEWRKLKEAYDNRKAPWPYERKER